MAYALLSGLFLALAVFPFTLYPLTLKAFRKRPLAPRAEAPKETFAICVCAYNEKAVIRQKAENLKQMKQVIPGLEVFIYVDAATDGTAEILKEYENDFTIHVSPERHGKTYGMNLLVAKATASIIIFSDANVMLDVPSISNLARYFADPAVGCVCGHLKYVNAGESATASTGSLYWKLEERIKQLESDTGSLMGADGSIFAIRRAFHHAPPVDIIDDMFVSFSILCDGYRIVRADDVIAYEQSVTAAHEEFRRKVRISCQAYNVHRLLWPRLKTLAPLDLYKYVAHKWLRWFTILWLALAVLCFELAALSLGFGFLGLVLIALGLGGLYYGAKANLGPLPQLYDILTAFAGTGLGVWRSLKGERFQTWAPAQSIRTP